MPRSAALEKKSSFKTWKMLIGSKWVSSQHSKTRTLLNPATGRVLAEVYEADKTDVNLAVENAKRAFEDGRWSKKSPGERALALLRLADKIEQNLKPLATLEMQNVGKPIKLAQDGDIPFAVDNLRFFGAAARFLEGRSSQEYATGYASVIQREPVGVVGLIAPWNYPFMMAVWKAAPALAAGNTVVLKPSEWTPLTTLELGRLALEAGIPEGVLNIVTGGEETGVSLTQHPDVRMISFTGDTETGKKIMTQTAPTLKKCHMELGGKAPFIVFEDADLEAAVQGAVVGAFVNTGQDCTAATRFYVQQPVLKKFLEAFVKKVSQIRVGDPSHLQTDMGPLVSEEQRQRVEGFVKRALKEGAKALFGGNRPREFESGFFFQPTVLAEAKQSSEIVQKEVFGPVVVVLPFKDEPQAIQLGNDVSYGLAASLWTRDVQRAQRVSSALQFGTVWINDHLPLTSEMPHGGFKQSGFGKDLSLYALEEYTQIKHVMTETTGSVRKGWHYTVYGEP
ncbi:MAG: gamma-aminobutyraldehyde dehydrogenase [Elusimicrobia bacterium]|nr:gamma-aminobutyraldehyde dehydrogenase [Elusimicrobiota bacterium]